VVEEFHWPVDVASGMGSFDFVRLGLTALRMTVFYLIIFYLIIPNSSFSNQRGPVALT
jgi:hypothetical protein